MTDPELDTKLAEEPPIDDSPISPVLGPNTRRRSSLEHHLQYRPERHDLEESCV